MDLRLSKFYKLELILPFDTLIKSYTSNTTKKITSYEELVECPFSELSLINKKNATEFSLDREIKQTLSNEIFFFTYFI